MSRETRKGFSRKKQMKGQLVGVTLPAETSELVNKLVQKYKDEKANTMRALMYVALKNNFDSDLEYIPCKERRPSPPMIANKNTKGKNILEMVSCSPTLLAKIDKLVEKNHSGRSAIMRMLICIAIQYNYDKDLNYKSVERISYEEKANQYQSNVVILLDEI